MRLLVGFALMLVSIAFVQGQLVVPQINNLNAVISLLPQFQGFIGQLDQILPQLVGILSSIELQSLKDKITQVVASQLGGNLNLDAIKDKLGPVLQQFLGSKPQNRFTFDELLQQIVNAAVSTLPGTVLTILGKREATDARAGLGDILALVDKYQLSTIIPHIEQFLSADKLQQLQTQFLATVVTALGNNWNLNNVAQALQQLVTQFAPQATQMRIDWEAVAQSALNGLASALPGFLIGALTFLGKRDLGISYQELLAQLPVNKIAQILQVINSSDKIKALANLRNLLQKFFPSFQGRVNFDDLAANLLNHLNTLLPTLSQSIFSTVLG